MSTAQSGTLPGAGPPTRLVGVLRFAGLLRGKGPQPAPVTLDRSRVFILPTGPGLGLGALLLIMLLGSVNYGNSLGLLLTFLLGSLAVISILHTHRNLAGLSLGPGRAEPVFSGETARFSVLVHNPARVRRSLVLRPRAGSSAPVAGDVGPGSSVLELRRPAERRGRLPLGPFVVETRYPLGLFRAWSVLELDARCLVYPKPAPAVPWSLRSSEAGDGAAPRGAGAGDFAGVRDYRTGESLRVVHWKASARAEELLSKHFSGEAGVDVWLDWNDAPGLGTEERLSRLCRWALEAHGSGRPWGLRLPDLERGPSLGEGHLHRCLAALAEFEG